MFLYREITLNFRSLFNAIILRYVIVIHAYCYCGVRVAATDLSPKICSAVFETILIP